MTNPILSNDISNSRVITWQYDKAVNLINLITKWNDWASISVKDFWDYILGKVVTVDDADSEDGHSSFGLAIWGNLLGIPRPKVIKQVSGKQSWSSGTRYKVNDEIVSNGKVYRCIAEHTANNVGTPENPANNPPNKEYWEYPISISDDLYRRLLKARFFMMYKSPTVSNYNAFLHILFPKKKAKGPWYDLMNDPVTRQLIADNPSMSYSYDAETGITVLTNIDESKYYPAMNVMSGAPDPESGFYLGFVLLSDMSYHYVFYCTGDVNSASSNDGEETTQNRNRVLSFGDCNFQSYQVTVGTTTKTVWGAAGTMSMGFTFPSNATEEEAMLIFQHYDVCYPFPAAIRTNSSFMQTDFVIGLNHGASGQNYRNFANEFAWATDSAKNGGILSTTDGANYYVKSDIVGKAYTVSVSSASTSYSITFPKTGTVWVDWGDGDNNYRDVTAGGILSHSYQYVGTYAVAVYSDDSAAIPTKPAWAAAEYTLNVNG